MQAEPSMWQTVGDDGSIVDVKANRPKFRPGVRGRVNFNEDGSISLVRPAKLSPRSLDLVSDLICGAAQNKEGDGAAAAAAAEDGAAAADGAQVLDDGMDEEEEV